MPDLEEEVERDEYYVGFEKYHNSRKLTITLKWLYLLIQTGYMA
ncbi:hypothetical protein [Neobacillus bataviensis]|nr:hypothetical protein [Neobacillus bataviensis]